MQAELDNRYASVLTMGREILASLQDMCNGQR